MAYLFIAYRDFVRSADSVANSSKPTSLPGLPSPKSKKEKLTGRALESSRNPQAQSRREKGSLDQAAKSRRTQGGTHAQTETGTALVFGPLGSESLSEFGQFLAEFTQALISVVVFIHVSLCNGTHRGRLQ